jgi:putative mRNA 3-end processing factor
VLDWSDNLRIVGSPLYLDSRSPRPLSFVSHAHSDHIALHDKALATAATAALSSYRLGSGEFTELRYDEAFKLDSETILRAHPAGHILGSAMLHVTRPEGTLLFTGDFKLRPSLTCPSANPAAADHLVMESTFGHPCFRFPPPSQVMSQLVELVRDALCDGRQPIVMGYSLGKSQEIVKILTGAGIAVTLHGAPYAVCRIYEQFGVDLGRYRRYVYTDFAGPDALPLEQRGALVAPPYVARTTFTTRFKNPLRVILTGWAMLKDAKYRYGVDHALPLSDHADFNELMDLIEIVRPKKIFTHHGPPEFCELLRGKGLDAVRAVPDPQMLLFE